MIKEQRLPVFNPRWPSAFGDLAINRFRLTARFKALTPTVTKLFNCGGGGREFMCRQQANFIHFRNRTLVLRIESANGVDFIIKKINPKWVTAAHREEIEDRTATCVFTWTKNLIDMAIAAVFQLEAQLIEREKITSLNN